MELATIERAGVDAGEVYDHFIADMAAEYEAEQTLRSRLACAGHRVGRVLAMILFVMMLFLVTGEVTAEPPNPIEVTPTITAENVKDAALTHITDAQGIAISVGITLFVVMLAWLLIRRAGRGNAG